ncbi:phosphatidate cytidylyltransferase [Pseudoalteromonas luteoviolacea]|uniref:Phosphatidate cytidylyltransferase n=1 Tax=Pseudoalteromonas luteoviolacea S4054 TaxID=1129367 RepID=A0A0F6AGX6_9GAMM|nr:phosphatidate cytidylyltransferase [Pseudoalteromonas luteoviolacea]AOT07539.1 phosphatidate cytidylyltransferase [Pseudoalteromonas luteoviolacea]AOT12455.1 phosphatidate cytidylyltransferase [Pseudoalteromonas luteoviolacea]AOT17369.1 phosphatidate cytidylyltransferase [Pseudoalteromonas luteoviolacea]KKE84649.1 phosphatidate cytidylyltransferase [Pseudoalteromonas luteoviolacea S4054]KZN74251.1 phosphatidate cytidylyltransferase [Pseudoalteromonas luteoviolacea S4047-1]
MLKQRIMTSAVLAPLALILVFYTPLSLFSVIAASIVLLGAWEWASLMGISKPLYRLVYVAITGVFITILHFHWPIESLWHSGKLVADANYVFTLAAAWWIVATLLVMRYPKMAKSWSQGLVMPAIAGFLTLIPLWLALNVLRSAEYQASEQFGSVLIMVVLGIVWSADIGAYFAGKNLGKRKLMPNVSPNKTIEGLIGGLITAVVFVLIFCYCSNVEHKQWLLYGVLTVVIALFSAIGDLLESMFKREAGLKDSGSCLPGHGGILDRIDSLTAAAPMFALFYAWTVTL